jgi:hypothetical protein
MRRISRYVEKDHALEAISKIIFVEVSQTQKAIFPGKAKLALLVQTPRKIFLRPLLLRLPVPSP